MKNDDFFGIGTAITACTSFYFQSARHTGRTSRLVNCLKAGDMVICINQNHVRFLEQMLFAAGKDGVKVVAVDPLTLRGFEGLPVAEGFTYFDHMFVQAYHEATISRSIQFLAYNEARLSRSGQRPTTEHSSSFGEHEIYRWRNSF